MRFLSTWPRPSRGRNGCRRRARSRDRRRNWLHRCRRRRRKMAERMIELLRDPQRARAMGKRGKSIVEEKFSCEQHLQTRLSCMTNLDGPTRSGCSTRRCVDAARTRLKMNADYSASFWRQTPRAVALCHPIRDCVARAGVACSRSAHRTRRAEAGGCHRRCSRVRQRTSSALIRRRNSSKRAARRK